MEWLARAYNSHVEVLWWVGAWMVALPLVLLVAATLCRAGHREDVIRHYVEDRPADVSRRGRRGAGPGPS